MRFTFADWRRLVLACIAASTAMAVLSGAIWAAVGVKPLMILGRGPTGIVRSPHLVFAVALALSLAYMPLNALAAWPVLRSCVEGLELASWLREAALGLALASLVSVPALLFLLLVPGSEPRVPLGNAVGSVPAVAASTAALIPPGLLLQRRGGVRAWWWPLLLVAVAMGVPAIWRGSTLPEIIPTTMLMTLLIPFFAQPWLVAISTAVGMGILSGLVLGAGLFVMARLSRPALVQ